MFEYYHKLSPLTSDQIKIITELVKNKLNIINKYIVSVKIKKKSSSLLSKIKSLTSKNSK